MSTSPLTPSLSLASPPGSDEGVTTVQHVHQNSAPRRALRVGPSMLRMSVAARILIALILLAPLWLAVFLVLE
ncbi:MAG: hypothetical protein AB7E29_14420 [Xanthobacter sp.]